MSKQSVVCIRSNMSSYWEFLTKRPDLSSICWKKAVADPAGLSDNYWGTYSFVCIYKKIKLIKDCALKVARESIRLIIDDVDTISTGRGRLVFFSWPWLLRGGGCCGRRWQGCITMSIISFGATRVYELVVVLLSRVVCILYSKIPILLAGTS